MNKLVTPASAASSVLSENISAVATSLRLANADNFTSSGVASISNIGSREIVTYSGKDGNKLTGVTRGTNGTTARPFALGVSVTQPAWMPVIAESDTLATTAELGNITKSSIGLNNVDNTSDANKPVSSATQSALDAKQPTLVSGTTIKTVNGTSLLGSGNIAVSGSAPVFTVVTKDVGIGRSGVFDITGLSGLTADKPVTVVQTSDPITSKGGAKDEPEMDMIQATGYTLNTTSIRVTWQAPSIVVGEYNFGYMV